MCRCSQARHAGSIPATRFPKQVQQPKALTLTSRRSGVRPGSPKRVVPGTIPGPSRCRHAFPIRLPPQVSPLQTKESRSRPDRWPRSIPRQVWITHQLGAISSTPRRTCGLGQPARHARSVAVHTPALPNHGSEQARPFFPKKTNGHTEQLGCSEASSERTHPQQRRF